MGRRELLRCLDAMYEPRGQLGDPCTYCGVVSDTMDHIPPLVVAQMTLDASWHHLLSQTIRGRGSDG